VQLFRARSGYTSLQRARLLLSMALSSKPNALIIAAPDWCDPLFRRKCEGDDTAHGEGRHDAAARKPDAALQRRLCESAMWLSAAACTGSPL
jgi:ABC-type polysaccharide/polyol phosphate transport system ATPase subunit